MSSFRAFKRQKLGKLSLRQNDGSCKVVNGQAKKLLYLFVHFIRFIGQHRLFVFDFNQPAEGGFTFVSSVLLKTRSTL